MQADCVDHGRAVAGDTYARIKVDGKMLYLHRVVLERKLGRSLLAGEVCRHTCDNRRCINEDHLIPGTRLDNVKDMVERSRQQQGDTHAHAKLSLTDVEYARRVYIPGHREFGCTALARQYGVSPATMSVAINRKTWRNL